VPVPVPVPVPEPVPVPVQESGRGRRCETPGAGRLLLVALVAFFALFYNVFFLLHNYRQHDFISTDTSTNLNPKKKKKECERHTTTKHMTSYYLHCFSISTLTTTTIYR
jgi:hypothetical protein